MIRGNSEGVGKDRLWKDFVQAVQEGDENQVRSILLAPESRNNGSGKPHSFLTRKIRNSQETLTALHLAVKHGKADIVKLLLKEGSNIHVVDHKKYTALHTAVVCDHEDNVKVIQLLLDHRDININAADEYGNTAIKLAAETGNVEAVRLLSDKGADISIADMVGNTALHIAAANGQYKILMLLLPKIAGNPGLIGQQNKDANTPLHLAVSKQCEKTVALLLYNGATASLGVKNKHDETPKKLAADQGDKGIIRLLDLDPSKAREQFQELLTCANRPPGQMLGRGCSVEADSPVTDAHRLQAQVASNNSLLPELPGLPGFFQNVSLYVNTPQMVVRNEYKTEVSNGAYAAIGPGGQVNVGNSPVTAGVRPQPLSAGSSSYDTQVSGGNASIGDHSITNVVTGTPSSTPSTAGSIEPPWFPEHPDNRDNRTERSSGRPTEDGSLPHPVPEEKSSGTPSESVSKSPSDLPYSVPEVSKKGSVCDTPGQLSNPVPETARSGIPTENTNDCDAPDNLPTPVPEESRPKTEEIVTSTNSTKDGSVTKEDGCVASPKSSGEVTNTIEPSRDSKTRRTPIDTKASNTPGSVRNGSGEQSGGANESTEARTLSSPGISARGVPRVSANGKSSNSHGNTRIIQPVGSSGNVGKPKAGALGISPSKTGQTDAGWGQALQTKRNDGTKRDAPLSRGVPKEVTKRLLEMESNNSSTTDPTLSLSDIRPDQGPGLGAASHDSIETQQLPESQKHSGGETGSKSQAVECQSNETGKKGVKGVTESGGRLHRVGLRPGRGSQTLVTERSSENQRSPGFRNTSASDDGLPRLSSSSKEAPHRKERFLRDDSVPDGENPTREGQLHRLNPKSSTGAALAGQDESVNSAGIIGESSSEQRSVVCDNETSGTQPSGLVDSLSISENGDAPIIRNANPEDDVGGTNRCDNECTVM